MQLAITRPHITVFLPYAFIYKCRPVLLRSPAGSTGRDGAVSGSQPAGENRARANGHTLPPSLYPSPSLFLCASLFHCFSIPSFFYSTCYSFSLSLFHLSVFFFFFYFVCLPLSCTKHFIYLSLVTMFSS